MLHGFLMATQSQPMRVCNPIVTNLTMYRHETTRDDVDTASMRRHETLCRKVFCDDCDAPPTRPAGDGGAPLDVHRSGDSSPVDNLGCQARLRCLRGGALGFALCSSARISAAVIP